MPPSLQRPGRKGNLKERKGFIIKIQLEVFRQNLWSALHAGEVLKKGITCGLWCSIRAYEWAVKHAASSVERTAVRDVRLGLLRGVFLV